MAEEDTQARLTRIETRMDQMTTMLVEIKDLIMTLQVASQAVSPISLVRSKSSVGGIHKTLINDNDPEEEILLKPTPVDMKLDDGKGDTAIKDREKSKGLFETDKCLITQELEHQHREEVVSIPKIQEHINEGEPKFMNQYDGTGCPRKHLQYFLQEMSEYSNNVSLLIGTFHESLKGPALAWYFTLNIKEFTKWGKLASEFLCQYRCNTEVMLTREDLVRVVKHRTESFCTFAQKWEAVASQIKPAIQEGELIELFLKALPFEYFDKMYTSDFQTFACLVEVGEKVEWGMKEKKVASEQLRSQYSPQKDSELANEMTLMLNPSTRSTLVSKPSNQARRASKMQEPKKKRYASRHFSPLPCPLSQLFPKLLEGHMVAKEVPRDSPPRFSGFDETKTCTYHMGEKGHDVDNCLVLKVKVQNLIDGGMLSFKGSGLDAHQNQLPGHH